MTNKITHLKDIELYLEKVKVPFVALNLSEAYESFPTLNITLSSETNAVSILPGTLVHVFAELDNTIDTKPVLIFEGRIVAMQYARGASNNTITLSAQSVLSLMFNAQFRPPDSLANSSRKEAEIIRSLKINNDIITTPIPESANSIKSREYKKDRPSVISTKGEPNALRLTTITQFGGIFDELTKMLKKGTSGSKGDYLQLFHNILNIFEKNDPLYGAESTKLKFNPSIFIFPNFRDQTAFRNEAAINAFKQMQASNLLNGPQDKAGLISILQQIKTFLQYEMVTPAIYPKINHFITQDNVDGLFRMFFIPRGEVNNPPLANIFFPEEVVQLTYTRDMSNEPTRLLSELRYQFFGQDAFLPSWAWQVYKVPDIPVEKNTGPGSDDMPLITGATFEETYRGMALAAVPTNATFAQLIASDEAWYDENNNKLTGRVKNDVKEAAKDRYLREEAIEKFYTLRTAGRTASITAIWNPYRLIGFSALAFAPGEPTVLGKITQINTSFNPNGQAISNITLSNCRLINDEINDESQELSAYLIDDFMLDPITGVNDVLYNTDLYGFENLGKFLYTYIMYGKKPKGYDIQELVKEGVAEPWKGHLTELNALEENFRADNSVLNFIRDSKGELSYLNLPQSILTKYTEITSEQKHNLYLFAAIRALKKRYTNLRKSDTFIPGQIDAALHRFIDLTTFRNLVSKSDYETYLGIRFGDDIKKQSVSFESYSNPSDIFTLRKYMSAKSDYIKDSTDNPEIQKILDFNLNQDVLLKHDLGKLKALLRSINAQLLKFSNAKSRTAFLNETYDVNFSELNAQVRRDSTTPDLFIIIKSDIKKILAAYYAELDANSKVKLDTQYIFHLSQETKLQKDRSKEELAHIRSFVYKLAKQLDTQKLLSQRKNLCEKAITELETELANADAEDRITQQQFRIFNKTRYAHVLKGFRYLTQTDVNKSQTTGSRTVYTINRGKDNG